MDLLKFFLLPVTFFLSVSAYSSEHCSQYDGRKVTSIVVGYNANGFADQYNAFRVFFEPVSGQMSEADVDPNSIVSNEDWNLDEARGRAMLSVIQLAAARGKTLEFYDHYGSDEHQCDDFDQVNIVWNP